MPNYQHNCNACGKELEFYRPISESNKRENCPNCGAPTERIYTFQRPIEFWAYHSETLGGEIRTKAQEDRAKKRLGLVSRRDMPYKNEKVAEKVERYKEQNKRKNKKPASYALY